MYSENDEIGVLEVLEIIFFSLPGYGGQTFTKIFTWIFRGFYNSVIFVEKTSKFLFLPLSVVLKTSERK